MSRNVIHLMRRFDEQWRTVFQITGKEGENGQEGGRRGYKVYTHLHTHLVAPRSVGQINITAVRGSCRSCCTLKGSFCALQGPECGRLPRQGGVPYLENNLEVMGGIRKSKSRTEGNTMHIPRSPSTPHLCDDQNIPRSIARPRCN